MVENIEEGAIAAQTAMRKGFVITEVNDTPVKNIDEFQAAVTGNSGKLRFAGFYPGRNGMYYYGVQLD